MSLLDCTKRIMAQVESLSGRPVRVQEDPGIQTLSTMKTARGTASMHLIIYRPIPGHPPDYLICYQCGFVIRLFETSPDARFNFGPSSEASSKFDVLLEDCSLPPEIKQMKERLLSGLLTQLRSIPIGLRIDEWLWSSCPELRTEQTASARLQLQQNVQVLTPSIRKSFPKEVVNANTAMNAAFAQFWAEKLNDASIILPYRSIGADLDSKALMDIFRKESAEPANDRHLVDRWAEQLKLVGWYNWIPYTLEG